MHYGKKACWSLIIDGNTPILQTVDYCSLNWSSITYPSFKERRVRNLNDINPVWCVEQHTGAKVIWLFSRKTLYSARECGKSDV